MFSFSKVISLCKKYELSSAGNKFSSFLILLFVNAKTGFIGVNHPLLFVVPLFHSSPQVRVSLHIHSARSRLNLHLCHLGQRIPQRPFTSHLTNTAVSPVALFSSITQPNVAWAENNSLFFSLKTTCFCGTSRDRIPQAYCGWGCWAWGSKIWIDFYFLWDLFKAGHFQSGLGDAMEIVHLFELASGRYETDLLFLFESFHKLCSLATTLTVTVLKVDFLNFILILWTEGQLRGAWTC